MNLDPDPCTLIPGLHTAKILNKDHRRLFNIITFAARKNILMFWIRGFQLAFVPGTTILRK